MASKIPFEVIDWQDLEPIEDKGTAGMAYWQTKLYDELRVRIVEYSPGYIADHWCEKGHIVHCLEGSFDSEMEDGQFFTLTQGMTYIVSDGMSSHKSHSKDGVKLLIVDGEFLNR